MNAVLSMQRGIRIAAHCMQLMEDGIAASALNELLRFPISLKNGVLNSSALQHIQRLSQQHAKLVRDANNSSSVEGHVSQTRRYLTLPATMLQSELQGLVHLQRMSGCSNADRLRSIDALFSAFVSVWQQQTERQRQLKEEKDALYKLKPKTFGSDVKDEKQIDEDLLASVLPDYTAEFNELAQSADSDGTINAKHDTEEHATHLANDLQMLITDDCKSAVHRIFTSFFSSSTSLDNSKCVKADKCR